MMLTMSVGLHSLANVPLPARHFSFSVRDGVGERDSAMDAAGSLAVTTAPKAVATAIDARVNLGLVMASGSNLTLGAPV